jgi:hypothetical protein
LRKGQRDNAWVVPCVVPCHNEGMNKRDRTLALAFAAAGTALLLSKGWQGLVLFFADMVEASAGPTENFSAVLPGFLICVGGVILLAASHLVVLWKSRERSRIFDFATGSACG